MCARRIGRIVFGALLLVAGMWSLVRAGEMSEFTKMTFQRPVRIPGHVLPSGSYYFTRLDDGNDPNVNLIQVFDSDKKPLNVILQTITVQRECPRVRTVLTFAESPDRRAPAG